MTASDGEVRLLQTLLAAEQAAVYGYGVLGARLDDVRRAAAQQAAAAHRLRRDQVAELLTGRGAAAPGPLASYDVAVAGAPEAVTLAVRLEVGLGVRWRDLVGGTDDAGLRRLGVSGLAETAVRAAQWRASIGTVPPTVPLPGIDPGDRQPD